jgi:hypothetical protein
MNFGLFILNPKPVVKMITMDSIKDTVAELLRRMTMKE